MYIHTSKQTHFTLKKLKKQKTEKMKSVAFLRHTHTHAKFRKIQSIFLSLQLCNAIEFKKACDRGLWLGIVAGR